MQSQTAGLEATGLTLPREERALNQEEIARVRRFHLGAEGSAGGGGAYVPAPVHPFRGRGALRTEYPLVLYREDAAENPIASLEDTLAEAAGAIGGGRALRENLLRLEKHVIESLGSTGAPRPAGAVLAEAGTAMTAALGLAAEDGERLAKDLEALRAAIPPGTMLLPFGEEAPLALLLHAARLGGHRARVEFAAQVAEVAEELRGLVAADRRRRPENRTAEAVGASIGSVGEELIDPAALAGMLAEGRGDVPLSEERLARLQETLEVLDAYTAEETPVLILRETAFPEDRVPEGAEVRVVEDPCRAAEEGFDERAAQTAAVIAAMRRARLLLDETYDAEKHEPWLDRFNWQGFHEDELRLIPTVVALEQEESVARGGMATLSHLLLSGRPVQVVVMARPAKNPGGEEAGDGLAGFRFEAGYLGLSHREAVVQQSAATRPDHLFDGFLRSIAATRAALHVIASEDALAERPTEVGTWLTMASALEGRAHPLFHYDPEAGATWARRFDIEGNPERDGDWPVHSLEVATGDGKSTAMDFPFTFADFALLDPVHASHFLPLPGGATDEFLPMAEYLALDSDACVDRIPFVWGADREGRLVRLAVTLSMTLACRDRLNYWRTLQELAGVQSEYVLEAERRGRTAAMAEAEAKMRDLAAAHDHEVERLRRDAVTEVVDRLTAALLEVDPAEFAGAGGAVSPLLFGSQDEVAGRLLDLVGDVDPAAVDDDPGNDAVNRMASDLMELLDR